MITPMSGYHALRMTWGREIIEADVTQAFRQITEHLARSTSRMTVVVDLTAAPNMPVGLTMKEALFGPYRNPKLDEWLIIGGSHAARTIERLLAASTQRRNVRWFDNENEVIAYLNQKSSAVIR
jgi:hypothetical protein